MGVCYTVIMYDEMDWGYVGTSKSETISKIQKEFEGKGALVPEVVASWDSHIVLDFDKDSSFIYDYPDIILNNCDSAVYYGDSSSYEKHKLSNK